MKVKFHLPDFTKHYTFNIEHFNLIEHYIYYMTKPKCRDEARLLLNSQ